MLVVDTLVCFGSKEYSEIYFHLKILKALSQNERLNFQGNEVITLMQNNTVNKMPAASFHQAFLSHAVNW